MGRWGAVGAHAQTAVPAPACVQCRSGREADEFGAALRRAARGHSHKSIIGMTPIPHAGGGTAGVHRAARGRVAAWRADAFAAGA